MSIEIIRNSDKLTKEVVHSLRLAVGWPSSLKNAENELQNTYSTFSAWVDKKCIGYVNSISDGVSDALINNLIISPEYQNKKVGSSLLKFLIKELRKDGVKFFNVVFEPRLEKFYKKCGFRIQSAGIMDFYDLSQVVVPEGWNGVEEKVN